jgi:hypothetical protein
LKLYEVSKKAMKYYRQKVKGNEDASDDLIRKKLTRNLYLATFDQSTKDQYYKVYWYGQLKMTVVGNKIVKLQNCKGANPNWVKDEEEYKRLNKLLGIPDDRSMWYKFKKWLSKHIKVKFKLKFT